MTMSLRRLEFHNGPWASLGASPAGDGPARSVRQLRLPISAALYAVANRDLARVQPWWRPEFASLSDAEVRVAFAAYSADADLAPGAVSDRPCHAEILAYVNSICSVGERPHLGEHARARPVRGVFTSTGQPAADGPADQAQAEPAGLCSGWLGLRSNPEAFVVTLDGDESDLRRGRVRTGPGLQQLLLESFREEAPSVGSRATDYSSDHVPFLRPHLMFPGGTAPGAAPVTPPPSVDVSDVADATSPDAFPRFLLDAIGAQGRHGAARGKWAAFFRYTEKEVGTKGGWVMVSEGRALLVGSLAAVEAKCKSLALAPVALVFQQPAVLRSGWAAVGETFMRHALARRVFARGFGADPPVDPWRAAPAARLPWGAGDVDAAHAGASAAAAAGVAAGAAAAATAARGTAPAWGGTVSAAPAAEGSAGASAPSSTDARHRRGATAPQLYPAHSGFEADAAAVRVASRGWLHQQAGGGASGDVMWPEGAAVSPRLTRQSRAPPRPPPQAPRSPARPDRNTSGMMRGASAPALAAAAAAQAASPGHAAAWDAADWDPFSPSDGHASWGTEGTAPRGFGAAGPGGDGLDEKAVGAALASMRQSSPSRRGKPRHPGQRAGRGAAAAQAALRRGGADHELPSAGAAGVLGAGAACPAVSEPVPTLRGELAAAKRALAEAQRHLVAVEARLAAAHECPICMDGELSHALVPSGKLVCAGCAERMKGAPDPWTKEPVQSSIRVYLPLSGEAGPA